MTVYSEIKILSSIDLGFATVSSREDGIINTNVIIDDTITLEQAKELFNAYLKLSKGKKSPHLITVSKFVIMEKDVMEFITKVANKKGKADAFVIHSLPQKIIGNFYLKFHNPSIPTKLFTSKEKAIAWLKRF
jgi:hypothetical protein